MGVIAIAIKKSVVPVVYEYIDDSSYDHQFTAEGEGTIELNENSRIGTATLKFDDGFEKLTSPARAIWNLGQTFTIDMWVRADPQFKSDIVTNGGARFVSNYQEQVVGETTEYEGYEVGVDAAGRLTGWYYHGDNVYNNTGPGSDIFDGAWHHVAFQSSVDGENQTLTLFLDGVVDSFYAFGGGSAHDTVTLNSFTIGARASSSSDMPFINVTIDELEIIDGVAKFTAPFTPPTVANTSTANHLLLMHFDSNTPAPTVWYDLTDDTYFDGDGSGATWDGSKWSKGVSDIELEAIDSWFENFKPKQVKITGTISAGSTIHITNGIKDFNIATGNAATSVIMQLTYNIDKDDFVWLQLPGFLTITGIFFDAWPRDPTN